MLELTAGENAVLEALSLYANEGRIDPQVSIGDLITQTGLSRAALHAAIRRLVDRNWIAPGLPVPWTDEHLVGLQGEGLARAAALAVRRELTLFEVEIAGICFYVSYEERARERGGRRWIARAHRADAPGSEPDATATGITRAKARDALVRKLGTMFHEPASPVVPCDIP